MNAALKSLPKFVQRAVTPLTTVRSGLLQRKCVCGGPPGPTGECEACRKTRASGIVQRKTQPCEVPPIVHEALRSSGQPLDHLTRAFFEPRFGHDFSRVRVHTDAKAVESARMVNALAYTVGRDVAVGSGNYSPGTNRGRR